MIPLNIIKYGLIAGILISISIFSSCSGTIYLENTSTSDFNIDILKPAGYSADSSIKTLCIIPTLPQTNSEISLEVGEKKINLPQTILISSFNASSELLNEFLSDSPRFHLLDPFKDSLVIKPDMDDWNDIDQFCWKQKTDAIIGLTDASIQVTSALLRSNFIPPGENNENDENGFLVGWHLEFQINTEFEWRMEIPEKHMVIIKKVIQRDRINTPNYESKAKASVALEDELQQILLKKMADACTIVAAYYVPLWETTSRIYFDKGNKKMRSAAKLMKLGKYDDAAEIWKSESTSASRGVSKEARYNLLLIEELNGHFEDGLLEAQQLVDEYQMPEAAAYVKIFKERIENQQILDGQFSDNSVN